MVTLESKEGEITRVGFQDVGNVPFLDLGSVHFIFTTLNCNLLILAQEANILLNTEMLFQFVPKHD